MSDQTRKIAGPALRTFEDMEIELALAREAEREAEASGMLVPHARWEEARRSDGPRFPPRPQGSVPPPVDADTLQLTPAQIDALAALCRRSYARTVPRPVSGEDTTRRRVRSR